MSNKMAISGNDNSSIFGGINNRICGVSNMIGGGDTNLIGSLAPGEPLADHSFIGGGRENWIDSTGAATTFGSIGGGQNNYIAPGTNHSSIFGGNNNRVTGNWSGIFGGDNNISTGTCSAILGGSTNNDAGLNDVFIAGTGITAVNPGSLHVNGLWANGIQFNPPTVQPVGTVFAMPFGAVPLWALPSTAVLWIA